jgi:CheY-like chemotaxis protein
MTTATELISPWQISSAVEPPEMALYRNHRILVVDDSHSIQEDFRKILSADATEAGFDAEEAAVFGESQQSSGGAQFTIDFAFQGQEALALVCDAVARGEPYALVFTDMRMPPGWDGLETTQKLWEVDPDLQIVICTAYSDHSWEEMRDAAGSRERLLILKKPFDTIEVLQFAHALTEKWSLLQAARVNTTALERLVDERTSALQASKVCWKRRSPSAKKRRRWCKEASVSNAVSRRSWTRNAGALSPRKRSQKSAVGRSTWRRVPSPGPTRLIMSLKRIRLFRR